jgi:hypothetical protein
MYTLLSSSVADLWHSKIALIVIGDRPYITDKSCTVTLPSLAIFLISLARCSIAGYVDIGYSLFDTAILLNDTHNEVKTSKRLSLQIPKPQRIEKVALSDMAIDTISRGSR